MLVALTVGIALITQMGEQADYLRFMPEKKPGQAGRWWLGTLLGGPGWVVVGVLKMLAGVVLFRRGREAWHDFGRVLIGLGLLAIVMTIYFKQGLWGFVQQRWGWTLFPTARRLQLK